MQHIFHIVPLKVLEGVILTEMFLFLFIFLGKKKTDKEGRTKVNKEVDKHTFVLWCVLTFQLFMSNRVRNIYPQTLQTEVKQVRSCLFLFTMKSQAV